MSELRFITHLNNGLKKNFNKYKENKLHERGGGSYFKYLYDRLDKGFEIDENTSTVSVLDKNNNPISVLIFFHSNYIQKSYYQNYSYGRIGLLGLYVLPEYRNKGIAKKMIKEFEKNIIDLYSNSYDYIIMDAVENAYPICLKSFEWFIPCRKRNSEKEALLSIQNGILKGQRTLKYYKYQKNNSLLY